MMDPLTVMLRQAWRASGLTLPQLAARAELSERTLRAILSGRSVQSRNLFRVCWALRVSSVPVPEETCRERAS
jgi:transcriptional regulator with XRE-family HTH domain